MRRPDERLKRAALIRTRLHGERLYLRDLVALLGDRTPRIQSAELRLSEVDRHLQRAEKAMDAAVDILRADNHAGA